MRVLLDACVLYPTVLREVLLAVAEQNLFEPIWSDRILEEWARASKKLGPEGEAQARGEVAVLKAKWPKASVQPRQSDLDRLVLPDDDDVHVLAAAIASGAEVLVTLNAKDFPRQTLQFEGIDRRAPDELLMALWLEHTEAVEKAARQVHTVACQMGGDIALRSLLKRAKLPRLGKAIAS